MCVDVCPAKSKEEVKHKAINMQPKLDHLEAEQENYDYFLKIPELDRNLAKVNTVKGSQLLEPLFEYSGACAGCGETPYVKLMTQLFGDRMLIGNATGCSSIYGGNLPSTPYTTNAEGRGPTWSNSLFEDNAEFGLGFRLAVDEKQALAVNLCQQLASQIGDDLVGELVANAPKQETEDEIRAQRGRVAGVAQASWPASIRPTPACWPRWPKPWSARASGSSAATAGPTISASAAWTTCWLPAAT